MSQCMAMGCVRPYESTPLFSTVENVRGGGGGGGGGGGQPPLPPWFLRHYRVCSTARQSDPFGSEPPTIRESKDVAFITDYR